MARPEHVRQVAAHAEQDPEAAANMPLGHTATASGVGLPAARRVYGLQGDMQQDEMGTSARNTQSWG